MWEAIRRLTSRLDEMAEKEHKQDQRLDVLEEAVFENADPRQAGYPGSITSSGDTDRLGQARLLVYLIKRSFDYTELASLGMDIGVDVDTLEDGTFERRATAFVTYCQRHGIIGRMVDRCRELRPHEQRWPIIDQSDEVDWK